MMASERGSQLRDPISLTFSSTGNLCSESQCANMFPTDGHSDSQKRHLKLVVSGSEMSSMMLPAELATSESESDMMR